LIDTNIIIEAWRVGGWPALAGGYALETVEECVMESQTGFQRRRPEQQIDPRTLRGGLRAVHVVTLADHAAALIRDGEVAMLDEGEKALWAHAFSRADAWVLCGPDRASLRIGVRANLRDRLISLERLLVEAGFQPKALREAYRQDWLNRALAELAQREGRIA
jgi:hypothetical protein